MKVTAFVYDFPHFKSAQGLFALRRAGFKDVRVVGAPWRSLGIAESRFQFKTPDMQDAHLPSEAAAALGYHYRAVPHDRVRLGEGETGIILGARILPSEVFEDGARIVNIHPGVLPLNRGLDTLKWAVHEGLPQAVTAHVIDARVDRGRMLFERIVPVHETDSMADIYNRVMWAQIAAVWPALEITLAGCIGAPIGVGVYRRPMTLEEDVETQERFAAYKHNYAAISGEKVAA